MPGTGSRLCRPSDGAGIPDCHRLDAAFLAGLDQYGQAALTHAPDAVYHAVRAWLFAAHVRALIGRLPVSVLVATALMTDPIAAITQACQHPDAGWAVPAVLAAIADRPDARILFERAVALTETIPDDRERGEALADLAGRLAAADPSDPALIDQAITVAGTIPATRSAARRWPVSPGGWPPRRSQGSGADRSGDRRG